MLSGRVDHVSEANRRVALVCGRDDPLGDRLRLPEDVRRAHRLVRGEQDEPLDAHLTGSRHDGFRAEHVRGDGFDRMRLEQRHLLVRRGVKHRVREVALEHLRPCVGRF